MLVRCVNERNSGKNCRDPLSRELSDLRAAHLINSRHSLSQLEVIGLLQKVLCCGNQSWPANAD